MRTTIIIGHGHFASGLLSAVEMIAGKRQNAYALDWTEDMSPYVLKERFKHLIKKTIGKSESVFVFVDMEGATPYQVAKTYVEESPWTSRIHVKANVNLPMLMKYMYLPSQLKDTEILEELAV